MGRSDWLRILIVGVGGQGVITAARILTEAARRARVPVVCGEIRNMAQRGGSVEASVVMGGARSPVIPRGGADVLLAFEPMEGARALARVGGGTVVVTNTHPVVPFTLSVKGLPYPPVTSLLSPLEEKAARVVSFDATELACGIGEPRAMNVVVIGALARECRLPVEKGVLEQVVVQAGTASFAEVNREAFLAGYRRRGA